MSRHEFGGPGEIPPARELVPMDVFENAIRAVGVVNACEWFGHSVSDKFTQETIDLLVERSKGEQA